MATNYTDPVIEFAKKKYQNLDCIADVFTFQIVWASENLTKHLGYFPDELNNTSIRKFLNVNPTEFLQIATTLYTGAVDKKTLIKKSGEKVDALGEIHSFMFNNCPYIAILNVKLV